jgi:uncharacterized membrane protein
MLFGIGLWLVPRYYFGVPFDTMLAGAAAVGFAVLIGYPLGLLVGHFVSRDSDVDTTAYRIVAGGNVVAWIVPVAGMTLAAATTRLARQSDATPTFYLVLARVGAFLALANAGIGGAKAYQQHHYGTPAPSQMVIRPADTPRSTERCPYAAQEQWSHDDVVRYCWVHK